MADNRVLAEIARRNGGKLLDAAIDALLPPTGEKAGTGKKTLLSGVAGAVAMRVATRSVPGAIVVGKVDKHEKFGVFVFLAPGKTGLIPFSETGVDRDDDLLKTFPPGSDVEVVVLEVDPMGRRMASEGYIRK